MGWVGGKILDLRDELSPIVPIIPVLQMLLGGMEAVAMESSFYSHLITPY